MFTICAFCGVATEQPHDSQEACIAALQAEINRTRQLLAAGEAPPPSKPQPSTEQQDVQST